RLDDLRFSRSRRVQGGDAQIVGYPQEPPHLRVGEGGFLENQRYEVAGMHDRQVLRGIQASPGASLLGERYQAQPVPSPTRDRQAAVVGEMVEVVAESFGRVKGVLRKRVAPRRGRGPRVHERSLDDVEARRAAAHEAAAVLDMYRHARVGVDA